MEQAPRVWRGGGWCVERSGEYFEVVSGIRHMGTATPRPDGWRILPSSDAGSEPALAPTLVDALVGLGLARDDAEQAIRALGGEPRRVPETGARDTAPRTGAPGSNN
jgi:hypothetical protein